MTLKRPLTAIRMAIVLLSMDAAASAQVVYDAQKLAAEKERLEKKGNEMWKLLSERLLNPDEKAALRHVRLEFPIVSSDRTPLNFYAHGPGGVVTLPIHSLLMLEDLCTAYAWLHVRGFSAITINEYAAMLKHRRPADLPGGAFPPPLVALGIPNNVLDDKQVDEMSLRFRNSAFAFAVAHEVGHVYYKHPGNVAVSAERSRANEQEADEFALRVFARDKQVPIGAILFFQVTAFTASPGRFDYASVEQWQKALRDTTHPVTSDRVRGVANTLRARDAEFGENRAAAVDIAGKLTKIATEMDDRDWQLYFRRIGQRASLDSLRPRKD